METEQLTVVIPAFNEAQVIAQVLAELLAEFANHSIDAEVIVVDDGSTDGTAEIAARAGVRVLQHHSNRGYGAALKTGILSATHEVVAIIDADGTYPARYLPEMLELIRDTDMVVGARIGPNVHIPLSRKPAKWVLNRLANYVTSTKIPDLNSGLRVFRRSIVLRYLHMLPDQFSFTTTITMAMLCDKYAVAYMPIDYGERAGKSKIAFWHAGVFMILIMRMAVLFRPLRVFLPLVGLSLAYGVAKMIIDLTLIGDRNISASAMMMMMSALVMLLIGMVADAIAIRLGKTNGSAVSRVQARELTYVDQAHNGGEVRTPQSADEKN